MMFPYTTNTQWKRKEVICIIQKSIFSEHTSISGCNKLRQVRRLFISLIARLSWALSRLIINKDSWSTGIINKSNLLLRTLLFRRILEKQGILGYGFYFMEHLYKVHFCCRNFQKYFCARDTPGSVSIQKVMHSKLTFLFWISTYSLHSYPIAHFNNVRTRAWSVILNFTFI